MLFIDFRPFFLGALLESVKLGSDENAKAALRKRILKKAATDFGIHS